MTATPRQPCEERAAASDNQLANYPGQVTELGAMRDLLKDSLDHEPLHIASGVPQLDLRPERVLSIDIDDREPVREHGLGLHL